MPGSWVGYDYYSTSEFYEDIARIAQRGVMDMLFFGDTGGTPEDYGGSYEAGVRYGAEWPQHDMAPMIPLMAKAASGVGFAITMSTTYHHPFYVARFFNALDHVTRGRVAWNAVTSAYKNEAANYGFDIMMDHDERYEWAQEFLEVACKLSDNVEKDALVADREKCIFADPAKVHRIDHRGRYLNVRGPLPALPSPQHRPVIIQAGLSGPCMDLAAAYADTQFSTRRTVASMQQRRAALDAKLAKSAVSPAMWEFSGRSASRSPNLMRMRRKMSARHPARQCGQVVQARHRRPEARQGGVGGPRFEARLASTASAARASVPSARPERPAARSRRA